eukprot:2755385-Lingulodinium_polyedra.AAC.1
MPNETKVEDILGDTADNLYSSQQRDSTMMLNECKRQMAVQVATIKTQMVERMAIALAGRGARF